MGFTDNFTAIVDGHVEFNIDDGHDQNLVSYCNKICQERCNSTWDVETPPECDCEVSRLYYAMVKLAEWENKGLTFLEYCKLPELIARNLVAWDTSKDKKEGLLPEVYLRNKGMYEKLTGEDYYFLGACKRFKI